jgi:hypothetical protein
MSSEWDSDSPSPHDRTLKISTSKIPTEREDRPIQNGQTDHLRLQVAVERGTLVRETTTKKLTTVLYTKYVNNTKN